MHPKMFRDVSVSPAQISQQSYLYQNNVAMPNIQNFFQCKEEISYIKKGCIFFKIHNTESIIYHDAHIY